MSISIEELIGNLIEALDRNTAAKDSVTNVTNTTTKKTTKKTATKKAATKAAAPAEDDFEEEELSRETVKKALRDYAALEGKVKAIEILKTVGASSIGEIPEDKLQEVFDATQ